MILINKYSEGPPHGPGNIHVLPRFKSAEGLGTFLVFQNADRLEYYRFDPLSYKHWGEVLSKQKDYEYKLDAERVSAYQRVESMTGDGLDIKVSSMYILRGIDLLHCDAGVTCCSGSLGGVVNSSILLC